MQERLQKIISRAGIASRRHAEQLILSGAVSVNGQVITQLGTKADAARDHITVGPRIVRLKAQAREGYFAFHKPPQVVSSLNDPEGRPCLGPYVRTHRGRLFPIGRLEFDAAGLLLLTSDGELASDLMRAAGAIPQTWRFKVKGRIPEGAREKIERGAATRLRCVREGANPWYEATLRHAPRDLLRQALQRQGILVEKMVRWSYGGIAVGELGAGETRELGADEVKRLRGAAQGRIEPVAEERHADGQRRPRRRIAGGREGMAEAVAAWRASRRGRREEQRHPGRRRERGGRPAAGIPGASRRGRNRRMPEGPSG